MKNRLHYLTMSIAAFFALCLVVVASTSISPQKARAESPNIIMGSDLSIGSSGPSVVVLQGLLSEMGYLNIPENVPFGYFGPLTRSAVAQYQSALGVSPAVGYFGPVTKTAMHNHFASRGWLALLNW